MAFAADAQTVAGVGCLKKICKDAFCVADAIEETS